MKCLKARAREEGRIYELLHLCVAGSCLNDAAGYTEERIPFNINLTEVSLTVMKWWVANGLEQAPAQWYQDAHSFCLGVNLLVRGSSPPPHPLQFSWPKKPVSALMVYWPVPAAINKHKVAWLGLMFFFPYSQESISHNLKDQWLLLPNCRIFWFLCNIQYLCMWMIHI